MSICVFWKTFIENVKNIITLIKNIITIILMQILWVIINIIIAGGIYIIIFPLLNSLFARGSLNVHTFDNLVLMILGLSMSFALSAVIETKAWCNGMFFNVKERLSVEKVTDSITLAKKYKHIFQMEGVSKGERQKLKHRNYSHLCTFNKYARFALLSNICFYMFLRIFKITEIPLLNEILMQMPWVNEKFMQRPWVNEMLIITSLLLLVSISFHLVAQVINHSFKKIVFFETGWVVRKK